MSFAVDAAGRAWVLDQVNERVQRLDPDEDPVVWPLPAGHYEDLALLPDGGVAVLDRQVEQRVVVLDADGMPRAAVPLIGAGVPAGGGVTGLFARDDGLWVEVEHRTLVRVADESGRADPDRPTATGRFTADGAALLTAQLQRPDRVILLTRPPAPPDAPATLLTEVAFALPVTHVLALDFDGAGRIVLAAALARFDTAPPYAVQEQRAEVVVLTPGGAELGRHPLPPAGSDAGQLRSISVGADGTVYRLRLDEEGATLDSWRLE